MRGERARHEAHRRAPAGARRAPGVPRGLRERPAGSSGAAGAVGAPRHQAVPAPRARLGRGHGRGEPGDDPSGRGRQRGRPGVGPAARPDRDRARRGAAGCPVPDAGRRGVPARVPRAVARPAGRALRLGPLAGRSRRPRRRGRGSQLLVPRQRGGHEHRGGARGRGRVRRERRRQGHRRGLAPRGAAGGWHEHRGARVGARPALSEGEPRARRSHRGVGRRRQRVRARGRGRAVPVPGAQPTGRGARRGRSSWSRARTAAGR